LLARWTMDNENIAGDTIEDTAGHTSGPFHGVRMNGGPMTGAGILNEAAEFAGGPNDGDHQYIDLASHSATLGSRTQGTIAAWVKTDASAVNTVLTIFAASDTTASSVETRFFICNQCGGFPHGGLVYGTRGSSAPGDTVSSGVNLLDGAWHHVAVTVDGTNSVQLYIDGILNASGTGGFFGNLSTVNSMAIGRNKDSTGGGGQWFYQGLIDDICIYTTAQNAARASGHFQRLSTMQAPMAIRISRRGTGNTLTSTVCVISCSSRAKSSSRD
jgi:hypothetical protein